MKYSEISQLKSGSKNSNARAQEGWGKHIFLFFPFQKTAASPVERASNQMGKKEEGLGEGIFARLLCPPRRQNNNIQYGSSFWTSFETSATQIG